MHEPVAHPLRFGRPCRHAHGPIALCLLISAALTPIVAPRASSPAQAPAALEPLGLTPFARIAPPPPIESATAPGDGPAMADLMVLSRDASSRSRLCPGCFRRPTAACTR